MAYYPYQNQYYTQLAQTYNPVQVPQQNVAPVQQNSNGSPIWVQGIEAAKSYMVAPNNTVLLMDSESQRFYLKSTDVSGMPLPLRVFEYTETTQNAQKPVSDAPAVDLSTYATKAEFDAFRDEIQGLLKNIPRQITRRSERELEDDA